ncbi:MAG: ABC transporter permease [Acidimicrobiia bacterium]
MFGVPIEDLALVLSAVVVVAVLFVAVVALRNRVFFRIGTRNIRRRIGRSALIVVGLMLATTIIAAALGTGDTMGRNVRNSVVQTLGAGDEWVTVAAAKPNVNQPLSLTPGLAPLAAGPATRAIEAATRSGRLVDAVVPALVRPVAVQDVSSRQTEPLVTMFAPAADRATRLGRIVGSSGRTWKLQALGRGRVLLEHHAADALGARPGDHLRVYSGPQPAAVVVADVVRYEGGGSPKSVMLLPLSGVRATLGIPADTDVIVVSNRGGSLGGADGTATVLARIRPVLGPLGLAVHPLKRDGLEAADLAGASFMQMFSTFGSFSIAAGILLIFLIFVMLAAERRTEMGVARAIGMQRHHLVETFVFEGAAYDLVAAAVGAGLGVLVSLAMVTGIGRAFAAQGIEVGYSVRWQSVVVAYALGVIITFAVVAVSAWRVSVLNIVTAVRNLPDPVRRDRPRRGLVGGVVALVLGGVLIVAGVGGTQTMPLMLGTSLVCIGAVPVARRLGVPDRAAFTGAGVLVVGVWLLPFRVVEALVPGLQMDFSMWIVGGLMIVLGSTWTVVYNADALLGAAMAVFGRIRSLAAVLRISMAYPLRTRLRTGMTLAMFTLVVFTLVVGITTPSSFTASLSRVETYGGGFAVRATTPAASGVSDMAAQTRAALGADARPMRAVASISSVPIQARSGTGGFVDYAVRGLDAQFLARNHYALGSRARGYRSDRAVWDALARRDRLAVVDPWIVPHRRNWNFGAITKLHLTGIYAEDREFRPVRVQVRDPQSGTVTTFTVIGVLRDSMPLDMAGIAISQTAAAQMFGGRAVPTLHLFQLAPGADASRFARRLESGLLERGVQADSFRKLVDDNRNGFLVFLRLIEGFMLLGLVVGVAALGVIAARSVVERRQQIGVLRAIGFQAATVRLGFLLESGFLALTSIAVGSGLGLLMAYNVVDDARHQATWPGVHLVIPWANLVVIFAVVLAVALLTTYLPARRASRVYAAEALRYQ